MQKSIADGKLDPCKIVTPKMGMGGNGNTDCVPAHLYFQRSPRPR